MVRVCAISYINAVPFVYGIKHAGQSLGVDMLLDTPSKCVENLTNGSCDIAIVPIASLLWLDNVDIVTNYSISACKKVRSVELLSDTPLNEITDIYLDEDSRTSAMLVRILCRELWGISPRFHAFEYGSSTLSPKYGEGYLTIGDKVFSLEHSFKYNHDLAAAWWDLTSLPFVFAVWVARKGTSSNAISMLDSALNYGISHIEEAINERVSLIDKDCAYDYLTNYIEYSLNSDKLQAIELFLNKAALLKSMEFSSPKG